MHIGDFFIFNNLHEVFFLWTTSRNHYFTTYLFCCFYQIFYSFKLSELTSKKNYFFARKIEFFCNCLTVYFIERVYFYSSRDGSKLSVINRTKGFNHFASIIYRDRSDITCSM